MPAILRYVRQSTRKTRRNQRVRLTVEVTPIANAYEVFNLGSNWSAYGRVSRINSMLAFGYSSRARPPFDHLKTATTSRTSQDARFAYLPNRHILMTYSRGDNVYRRTSTDDGLTWTGETLIEASASYADVACDRDGNTVIAYWKAGKLYRAFREPGETNFSSEVAMQDDTGSDLLAEEDSFRITYAPGGHLWLHYLPDGETTTEIRYSTDEGLTWALVPGSVTGIASAAHPGLCAGWDGTLVAFAVTGTTITTTRREKGTPDFDTPVELEDDTETPLEVRNNAVSLAPVREGVGRTIIALVKDGETQVSEWGSADDGKSAKRLPVVTL